MLEHLRNYIHRPKTATTNSTLCSSHSTNSKKKFYFVRNTNLINHLPKKMHIKPSCSATLKQITIKKQTIFSNQQHHITSQKIQQKSEEHKSNQQIVKQIDTKIKANHNIYRFDELNPMERYVNQYQTLRNKEIEYTHLISKAYQRKSEKKENINPLKQLSNLQRKQIFPNITIKENFHLNLFPNLCKKPDKKFFNPQLSLSSFKSLIAVNITTFKYFQIETEELLKQNKFLNKFSVFLMESDHDATQVKNIVFCLLNDYGQGSSAEHFVWNGEFFKHNEKMNLIKYVRNFIDRMRIGFQQPILTSYRCTSTSNNSSNKYKIKKCPEKDSKKSQPLTIQQFFKKIWIVDMCGRTSFIQYRGLFNVVRPISEDIQLHQDRSIFNNMKRQGQIHNTITKKKQKAMRRKSKIQQMKLKEEQKQYVNNE